MGKSTSISYSLSFVALLSLISSASAWQGSFRVMPRFANSTTIAPVITRETISGTPTKITFVTTTEPTPVTSTISGENGKSSVVVFPPGKPVWTIKGPDPGPPPPGITPPPPPPGVSGRCIINCGGGGGGNGGTVTKPGDCSEKSTASRCSKTCTVLTDEHDGLYSSTTCGSLNCRVTVACSVSAATTTVTTTSDAFTQFPPGGSPFPTHKPWGNHSAPALMARVPPPVTVPTFNY